MLIVATILIIIGAALNIFAAGADTGLPIYPISSSLIGIGFILIMVMIWRVIYRRFGFLGRRDKPQSGSVGNAPMGTNSKASQIGRGDPETQIDVGQPKKKTWGRGED